MHRIAITAVAVALLLGSCSQRPPAKTNSASGYSLVPITFTDWERELEAQKGQIVVVDMWATWCPPCIERFPHMVKMHDKYQSEGVRFISMCLDDRDDHQAVEEAREFLVQQNAAFSNYLMDENMTDAFEKLDIQGIPAVFIYDRKGELRYRLTGDDPYNQFTEEDVKSAITQLLRE